MRRLLTVALILGLAASMALAEGTQETGVDEEAPQELRIMWWGSQTRHERTIEVINMYAEETNVEITHEFAGWQDYWTKMTTMAAGNNLPDIMQHDYAFLLEWQARGLLKSLEPYVESGILDFSNVSESNLAGGRIDGELYGVNLGTNSQTIAVDVDMFEQAGIPVPDDDWTWDEFVDVTMKLHEELGVWGFGPLITGDNFWKSMHLSSGYLPFDYQDGGLGYDSNQVDIEYLNTVLRLQEAGAIPDISVEASDYNFGSNVENRPTIEGQAAMAYIWSNQLNAFWTAAGGAGERNFELVMLPRMGNRPANYVKPSQFFAITRDSQNPELAADFINYFTNSIEANEILLAERGVPVATHVREALSEMVPESSRAVFEYMGRVAEDSVPVPPPDPQGWNELLENVFKPVVRDGVRFGEYTPEEAIEIFRAEAEDILQPVE